MFIIHIYYLHCNKSCLCASRIDCEMFLVVTAPPSLVGKLSIFGFLSHEKVSTSLFFSLSVLCANYVTVHMSHNKFDLANFKICVWKGLIIRSLKN